MPRGTRERNKGRNRAFRLRGCHPLWPSFPGPSARLVLDNFPACAVLRPATPREPKPSRFGLFRVRSPLLTESLICFLFLRVLRWFTSPGPPLPAYEFSGGSSDLTRKGLPHSEIPGSKPVCGSPRLIAACHVLHRFSAPRHSPSTLSSLTIKYLRRESSSFYFYLPDSLVKDRDHRGSKSPPMIRGEPFHPRWQSSPKNVPSNSGALDRRPRIMVELSGIEPPTCGLQSRRSPS